MLRALLFSSLFFVRLLLAAQAETTPVGQPIPFSHKQHAENGKLKCDDCHRLSANGEVLSIPTGKSCMTCHAQVAKNAAPIQDLKGYVAENEPIPWIRIYEIPSFVEFNHRTHLQAGAKCLTCHGDVARRDRLWRETDISMGGCFTCHQQTHANTNCSACHNLDN